MLALDLFNRGLGSQMNALEIHILRTLARVVDAGADEFEECRSTLSLLAARGMIRAEPGGSGTRYHITEKGLARLDEEVPPGAAAETAVDS